jgi:hypothetical protein
MKTAIAIAASLLISTAAFAQQPAAPPPSFDQIKLTEAQAELHNYQDQVLQLAAIVQALQPKAVHADALDAWVTAYFAPAPSIPGASDHTLPTPAMKLDQPKDAPEVPK